MVRRHGCQTKIVSSSCLLKEKPHHEGGVLYIELLVLTHLASFLLDRHPR